MDQTDPERLRTPPRERFANATLSFDLDRAFEKLAAEAHDGIDGHRQITLFKDGAFTVLAILFEEQGCLPDHQADGIVTLQLLQGRLEVNTRAGRDVLGDKGLFVVQPNVDFSVTALEPAKVVMTVHLLEGTQTPLTH